MPAQLILVEDGPEAYTNVRKFLAQEEEWRSHFSAHESLEREESVADYDCYAKYEHLLLGKPVDNWSLIEDGAVVILDLYFEYCSLSAEEKGELEGWLDGDARRVAGYTGMYLLAGILKCATWDGMIVVASSAAHNLRVQEAVSQLTRRFSEPRPDRPNLSVVVLEEGFSITPEYPSKIQDLGDEFLRTYQREHGNVESRVWPKYTEEWFDDGGGPMGPHKCPSTEQKAARRVCVEKVRRYLKSILTYEPPEHWFNSTEFDNLHEDLKHLVGRYSHMSSGTTLGGKGLTLGNLAMLFGAIVGKNAQAAISNVHWESRYSVITPSEQCMTEAKDVYRALAGGKSENGAFVGLFTQLKKHKDAAQTIAYAIELRPSSLRIRLRNFPFLVREEGKDKSAAESLRAGVGGNTCVAYRQFVRALAVTHAGLQPEASIGWFSDDPEDGHSSVVEIRRATLE